jgi:cytochrome c biogenesis protein CcmG/thiol:disulfide interchange protein DsbE
MGLAFGLLAGLAIFWQNLFPAATTTLPPENQSPTVGMVAPDFKLMDAQTGKVVQLNDLRGQPVLVNFWATWCAPCRVEMPTFQAAYTQHQAQGLVILAVNNLEDAKTVTAFGDELGLTFPLLLDSDAAVQNNYRVRAFPSSYFIARDGTIAAFHLGALSETQLAENLALILSPTPSP